MTYHVSWTGAQSMRPPRTVDCDDEETADEIAKALAPKGNLVTIWADDHEESA